MHPQPSPRRATTVLFVTTALVTFAAVALGSVVCATDSSAACPHWPGCYPGQVTPEAHLNPVLEFVHRVVAVVTGPLLLATAVVALRIRDTWVRVLPWVALAGALVAGVLGMFTITRGISTSLAAFDLASSLVAMLASTVAAVRVLRLPATWRPARTGALARATVGTWVLFHLTSIFVAGPGSLTRCVSWPVWRVLDVDGDVAVQWLRLGLAGVALLLTAATVARAVRDAETRALGVVAAVLALVEFTLGLTVVAAGASLPVKGLYAALAGAVLATLGWIAALASTGRHEPARD